MPITALADIKSNFVDITTIPSGALSGVVLTNGAAPLTANWNAGNFAIASQNSTNWENIVAWGADPTGVANSSTAINNAIAGTSANGGVLYAPAGTYLIDTTITISKSITLIGDGTFNASAAAPVTKFQKKSTLNGAVFNIQASGVALRDFYVDGSGGGTGDGITIATGGGTAQIFTASRVTVGACAGNGWTLGGGSAAVVNFFKFDACVGQLNGGDGFVLDSSGPNANAGTMSGCIALNNTGDGFRFKNCQYNTIVGGGSENNTGNGYHFMAGSFQNTLIGGDPEANATQVLIDATAQDTFIYGVPSSKITNNSTAPAGTCIYSDKVLVSANGSTSISQTPAAAGAAFWDNLGVGLNTNFRSSAAAGGDTTWGFATSAGTFTFQKDLVAAQKLSTSESAKTLANGANQDVAVTSSWVTITGPTAAFSIGGVSAPTGGQIVTLAVIVGQPMTINHNDAGSAAANRIRTSTGANVTVGGGGFYQWATIQYSSSQNFWILLGHS